MEQDLYAAGYAAGRLAVNATIGELQRIAREIGYLEGQKSVKLTSNVLDLLTEVSDFLDNYTDAEYDSDGHIVGNRAMNLKASIDELIG